jgi:hypothetical protein
MEKINGWNARPYPDVDSLAPARSALSGHRFQRIPFAVSQAAQVSPGEKEQPSPVFFLPTTVRQIQSQVFDQDGKRSSFIVQHISKRR